MSKILVKTLQTLDQLFEECARRHMTLVKMEQIARSGSSYFVAAFYDGKAWFWGGGPTPREAVWKALGDVEGGHETPDFEDLD